MLGAFPVVALAGCSDRVTQEDRRRAGTKPQHVILVDWDGLDPDYLGRASTPNLDSLAERGSLSTARSTFPTISNPARASMSTGAHPRTHGNAAYYLDEDTGEAVGETRSLSAETVAETLAAEGRTLASVQWYMVEGHGASSGDPEHLYVEPGGAFGSRVDAAIRILERRPVSSGGSRVTVPRVPNFLAVYGSDLDDLGHSEGPDSQEVVSFLEEMDRELGRLVRATKDAGIFGQTAFMLTSDHGMSSWSRSLLGETSELASTGYRLEVLLPGQRVSSGTEVVVVPSAVRIADVTLLGRAATPEGRERVGKALEDTPHVAEVLDRSDLDGLRASDKHGDFIVEAEEGWGFGPSSGGDSRGAHGSTEEIRIPLLLSGAGIRQASPEEPNVTDVAPTICSLLGTRPPADASGRALSESLGEWRAGTTFSR